MECGSNHYCMVWLVISFLLIPFALAALGGNETDRLALLSFKSEITLDPFGLFISWNESVHFCKWEGVKCSPKHRVVELNLPSFRFVGRLSASIGNLSFLTTLNLQNNSFGGEVPQEIGSLSKLQVLNFDINQFVGEIPITISNCSKLQYIGFLSNNLTGILPKELGMLTNLQELELTSNKLFGELPQSLGNMTSLTGFWGTLNNFHGSIPNSLGMLKKLTVLSIGANNLTGTIPSSIYNISSIRIFSLPVNQLKGSLPTNLGLMFPNLETLRIHTNQFNGPIPSTLSNASKLVVFSISTNMFTGKVPSLASMRDLEGLGLYENNLVDDINFLSPLVNCTNLTTLVISDNNFNGMLPEYISNFSTKLRIVGFGRNDIHGTIPIDIGNLIGLEALGLEGNELSGHIPNSLGKLKKLSDLFLNMNKLFGTIPQSFGNMSRLGRCNLRLNNLTGIIPTSLGPNQNLLIFLTLSQNHLTGSIPKELLSVSSLSIGLDLSDNYLTGSIPLEVGRLVNLGYLHISNNMLNGVIPSTLGFCTSLEDLHLEGNSLVGSIPLSLVSLRGIEELDLSRNDLSGEIPSYLEELELLRYLNLSFNDLEGEVPTQGVFKNESAFSIIGNKGLCGGILELNLSRCNFDINPMKNKLSMRLKVIISVGGGLVGSVVLVIICIVLLFWSRKKKNKVDMNPLPKVSYLIVSYNDILKATNEFSPNNLIGAGGYGSVYKGSLNQDGSVVAIKVFKLQQRRASKSFLAECEVLRNLRHRNLVKILSACSGIDFQGNDFMALVYDFMVNGSLEKWLHQDGMLNQEEGHGCLTILQRLSIAIDVASALDYLHNGSHMPIVHCDLKPSNVLLDLDMTAHIGDFGLAKIMVETSSENRSTETGSVGIRGSIGYAPPEYAMGSDVSTYGDVYSYGIVLLEMFTGKRPTDEMFIDGLTLNNYVLSTLPDRVEQIGDPTMSLQNNNVLTTSLNQVEDPISSLQELEGTSNNNQSLRIRECLFSVFSVGVACSAQVPSQRMDISDVVVQLSLARQNFS